MNTERNTAGALGVFRAWLESRSSSGKEHVPEDLLERKYGDDVDLLNRSVVVALCGGSPKPAESAVSSIVHP